MMNARVFHKLGACGLRVRRFCDMASPKKPKPEKQWQGVAADKFAGYVMTLVVGVAVTVYGGQAALGYKQKQAVNIVKKTFKKTTGVQRPVPREEVIRMLQQRLAKEDWRTTVVAGQHQIGKSWLVDSALDGQKGVVRVLVDEPDWKMKMFKSLGLDDLDIFCETLRLAAKELGVLPIVYLDIPRDTPVSMREVSIFCKEIVTDKKVARAVVVASQISLAMGFDAGGHERQYNILIGPLTPDEAIKYIVENFARPVTESEAAHIVSRVGSTFGALQSIKNLMEDGSQDKPGQPLTFETALTAYSLACKRDVIRVNAINMGTADKPNKVGHIIMKAILGNEVCDDEFLTKNAGDTTDFIMATAIAKGRAHAITYDMNNYCWNFSSPMHKEVARDLL